MAKVTALRSLSFMDGDRRVTLKPGDTAQVSASSAKRWQSGGYVKMETPKAKPAPKAAKEK